jgi:hypothetical protein
MCVSGEQKFALVQKLGRCSSKLRASGFNSLALILVFVGHLVLKAPEGRSPTFTSFYSTKHLAFCCSLLGLQRFIFPLGQVVVPWSILFSVSLTGMSLSLGDSIKSPWSQWQGLCPHTSTTQPLILPPQSKWFMCLFYPLSCGRKKPKHLSLYSL